MTSKSDYFVDLIYEKFKKYKSKKIFLEKETLKQIIISLSKDA